MNERTRERESMTVDFLSGRYPISSRREQHAVYRQRIYHSTDLYTLSRCVRVCDELVRLLLLFSFYPARTWYNSLVANTFNLVTTPLTKAARRSSAAGESSLSQNVVRPTTSSHYTTPSPPQHPHSHGRGPLS